MAKKYSSRTLARHKEALKSLGRPTADTVEQRTVLQESFERLGWKFRQVFRKNDVAVYRRWKESSVAPHFEAIRIGYQKAREWNGILYPEGEHYPSDNQWGSHAFTLMDEASAIAKAKSMVSMARKKAS